jgi:hypothetical protein
MGGWRLPLPAGLDLLQKIDLGAEFPWSYEWHPEKKNKQELIY